MSNILNKFKKKKEENKVLTNEELENYKKILYKLKDLTINAMNRNDYSSIKKYGKEIKDIKKILVNANKVAKNNGKWVLC